MFSSRSRARTPALLGLVLLAALAACSQTRQQAGGHVAATHGNYNRPSSYDPPGPPGDPWGPWIREASRRYDVPERWIREVMRQESGGRTSATSGAGAMGLMQVMPGTYNGLRQRYGLGDDPYHPYDNLMAGTAYIREMYDLYGSPAFLAAYNAGPRRLEDYLFASRGLPNETRTYVARIGPNIIAHHPGRRAPAEVYAAAEIPLNIPPGPRRIDRNTMLALREQREAVQPGVQVAQLPAGTVVRMEPIPDGSTYAGGELPRTQLASADPRAPIPAGSVVRMDPIPDGSTPGGAAALAEAAARASVAAEPEPVFVQPALVRPALVRPPLVRPQWIAPARAGAEHPTMTRLHGRMVAVRTPPPAERGRTLSLASGSLRLPAAPAPAGRGQLALLGAAQAASLPPHLRAPRPGAEAGRGSRAGGGWAVQVGAFGRQDQARNAAAHARDAAASLGSRPAVQPVGQGRGTLYRARVNGLTPGAAQAACDRLRGRGACVVLSPRQQG